MGLLPDEISKALTTTSKQRPLIQKAIEQEDRLRFHVNICTDTLITNFGILAESVPDFPYYQKFIWWVKSLGLATDKFEAFKRLLTFPMKTNDICDAIADEYTKVFDSQDSFYNIQFTSPEIEEDFDAFGEDKIVKFIKKDGFRAMMSGISSIMIVDLPDQPTPNTYPEPYWYLLDIRRVVDIGMCQDDCACIDYIVFQDVDGDYVLLDDQYYRSYKKIDNKNFVLVDENPQSLGYCPAKFLWNDNQNHANEFLKQAPLSALLSKLDWYLFFSIAKENLDISNAYPIYWAFESKCDYVDTEGRKCVGGVIPTYQIENPTQSIMLPCPVCSNKKMIGWGALMEKPAPTKINDGQSVYEMAGAPLGLINVDVNALTYNRDECIRIKNDIISSATGKNRTIADQAVNESQVSSQFETQTNVLNWIARNFECSHSWLIDTICTLRYGSSYLGCSVNYGTKFYLSTVEDAMTDYQNAKLAGAPNYILSTKLDVIEHLQSNNNPEQASRLKIIKALEPYPTLSIADMFNYGVNILDKEGFVIKLNLITFVERFERENGDICDFGSLLSLSEKINRINLKFKEYAGSIGSETNGQTAQSQTNSIIGNDGGEQGQGSKMAVPSQMGQVSGGADE